MLDKFLLYIKQEKLFIPEQKVLLAVSGGVDSMVMLNLFHKSKFKFAVAHLNYRLRGDESEMDAAYLTKYCEENEIIFHYHSIDPIIFNEGNLQSKARAIRYEWFDSLLADFKYDWIATAHHKDDIKETFMINLMRGSGLKGLVGMLSKRNKIIRPLLFADKEEILQFAVAHEINFREDSSNLTDKYLRNKIRHYILPAMDAADPRAKIGFPKSIAHIQSSENLLNEFIYRYSDHLISADNTFIQIQLKTVMEFGEKQTLLYYLLQPYGFNESQCSDIMLHHNKSGKIFITKTHTALLDRMQLIIRITPEIDTPFQSVKIDIPGKIVYNNTKVEFSIVNTKPDFTNDTHMQYVCLDEVTPPYSVRKWHAGDTFAPLGMNGRHQKLQDFLTNIKLSNFEKENVLVVEAGNEIISLPGYRISEKVKITSKSKRIVSIRISY
ncbi:MAG: tRNA lysidine(34) synthetase TilS [Saprospiraceae bacterium]|nr:tRNA lysidine(34) synthetase TilS [Saprospiraceae bacterium]